MKEMDIEEIEEAVNYFFNAKGAEVYPISSKLKEIVNKFPLDFAIEMQWGHLKDDSIVLHRDEDDSFPTYLIRYVNEEIFKKYKKWKHNTIMFHKNNLVHRNEDSGPACISLDSSIFFKNGIRHRDNGPAILYDNGGYEWFCNGKRCENKNDATKPSCVLRKSPKILDKDKNLWRFNTKKIWIDPATNKEIKVKHEYQNITFPGKNSYVPCGSFSYFQQYLKYIEEILSIHGKKYPELWKEEDGKKHLDLWERRVFL